MTARHLGMLAIVAAAGLRVAAQAPTFSSTTEAVRVDVLVTERGVPVRGLTARDFEVIDGGVRQDVELALFEQLPVNAILALDTSNSVEGDRMTHLRAAGAALLDALRPPDQAALITFSQMVVIEHDLTSDLGRVRAALDGVKAVGDTSLIDAAYTAIVLGDADVGRSLAIVFSDGVDTTSWLTQDVVLDVARRANVVVYGVSAAARGVAPFLRDVGEATGGAVFEVQSTRDLRRTFLDVLDEFRQRYVISYSPRGIPEGGWHPLQVRVARKGVTVRSRSGYFR